MHTGQITTLANLSVVTANGERGLIGIEVDPNFWDSDAVGYQKIYVAYTNAQNYDQLRAFTLIDNTLSDEQTLVTSTLLANDFHPRWRARVRSGRASTPTGRWATTRLRVRTPRISTNIHGKILRISRDGSGVTDNPFYVEGGNPNTNRDLRAGPA